MLTRLIYALSVVLLLTAVACASPTTPTSPEPTATAVTEPTATVVPPTATAEPTPEPTATPTALELSNARATAVLTTLPGYDPDFHDALLPLARHLWGGEAALIDPALVALMPAPAHDLNPAGSLAVQVVDEDGGYPAGTLFVWAVVADEGEALVLRPLHPYHLLALEATTLNHQPTHTWLEYDENGRLHRFLDPHSRRWIAPLDLNEDGSFSIYTIQDTDSNNGDSEEFWWTNGGEPVRITSALDGRTLTDYLTANPNHTLSEIDGQLTITDGDTILFALNPETMEWEQAANPAEAFFVQAQELYGEPYGINLDPDVEIRPDGRMTIYSTVNGQRVETVRTAINDDGTLHLDENGRPVPLFATEAYALATSRPLEGGNLADRISIYYQPDVPRLDNGQFIILDEARVRAQVDAVLNARTGLPVQNVLSADQQTKNHLLTDESGTVTVEQVNVIFGRIRDQLPGYRAMYTTHTTTGPGSGYSQSFGYLWSPENPNHLTIMIYLDDIIFLNTDNDGVRNWLFMSSVTAGLALLQSTSRPVANFPKHGFNVFDDINQVGRDFIWLAVQNPSEGWYRAVDFHVSND